MATANVTTSDSWSKANPCREVSDLQDTIENMDGLSQEAFGEISAIAKLVAVAIENEHVLQHPRNIIMALRAIAGKADDIKNLINCEAEHVGCNHVSRDLHRPMQGVNHG